jgi:hypothetical protein
MILRRTLVTAIAIAGVVGASTSPVPRQPGYDNVAYEVDCDSSTHPGRAEDMTSTIRLAANETAGPININRLSAGIAFYDRLTDTTCYFNPDKQFNTASIVKVLIAVALEWQAHKEQRPVTADIADKMRTMITSTAASTCHGTESNCAAVDLWQLVHGDDEHRVPHLGEVLGMLHMSKTVPDSNNAWGSTVTTARDQLKLLRFLTSPGDEFLERDRRAHVLDLMVSAASEYPWGTGFGAPEGTTRANKIGWTSMSDVAGLSLVKNRLLKELFGFRTHSIGAIHGVDDNGHRHDYMMAILTDLNNRASGPIRINAAALVINTAMKQYSPEPVPPVEPEPTSGTSVPPAGAPVQNSAGPYQIRFEPTGKCVDNHQGSPSVLNAVQQWVCARPGDPNAGNQDWYFDWEGDGRGYAKIRNTGTGMCLDVRDHSTGNGAPVVLQTCSDSVSWKGFLKHDGDVDHYELRPRHAGGKCLDLPHSSSADGVRLQQWDCVSGNHQQHLTWSR